MKKFKGKYGAILLAVLMMISFVAGNAYAATVSKATDFKDVAKDAWYYDYVACLADRGVVQGYGDTGEYQPMNLATREHAAKMIALAAGLDHSGKKADFPDVDPLGEFSPYIAALVEKGAIQGFPDGSFRPQDTIKRSHAAKMIQLAFGLNLSTKEINIIDLPTHDPELVGAIEVLASNGVVKGYGDSNRFKPDHDVNRAEFAKMLCIAITAKAIQEAETLRTPAAISRAQALVDGMSNDQDTNTRSFLQTRLDTLKEPVAPDPGKPDVPGPVPVESVEIEYEKDSFIVLEEVYVMKSPSLQLSEKIKPANASNKAVTWSSSDIDIATVDKTGKVTATGKGPVKITVTTVDGSKKASIEFIVPIFVGDVTRLTEVINGNGVDAAGDGDYVLLAAGKYVLTKTLVIDKSITLLGPQAGVDPRPSQDNPPRAYEADGVVKFRDDKEAILTGAQENDPNDKPSLEYLIKITANWVTINGLTMERTYDHIIHSQMNAAGDAITGLEIVNNIVRHGRGNEGIKVGQSVNALVQYNFIYDIKSPGDAIEAYEVKGFRILDNEINGCSSGNGTIRLLNLNGGIKGIVEGNLIKDTSYQFAIVVEGYKKAADSINGHGDIEIKNNKIIDAKTGGIFVYKYTSAQNGEPTKVEITDNEITKYALAPPSGNSYVDKYLCESASAIAVSYNLQETDWGNQSEVSITGNTISDGAGRPVMAFGGGSPGDVTTTDLSKITVRNNTFSNSTDVKYIKATHSDLEQFKTDLQNKNTWVE